MSAFHRLILPVGWLPLLLLAAVLIPTVVAQVPPPPMTEAGGDAPLTAAAADNADNGDETGPLREQTIYIPYSKLRSVFEKEGRGVFLPYDKFQQLWQAAQQAQQTAPEPRPPVDALISEISSDATALPDVLLVTAQVKIELLKEGWHRIPLRLGDAAIRSARIGDQPARLVNDPQGGYALLVERTRGSDPQTIELSLEYAKAIQKTPGKNSVSIQAPQAPVNRWQVRIPEEGVKVDIRPLIAATQPPDQADEASSEETVVLAFVGSADTVTIDWNPKAEGASGLAALVAVQAEQEVTLDEGLIRSRIRLAYQVSRSELTQLEVEVPADHKVAAVYDPNVRQWEVTTQENVQRIRVQLFEPATANQGLTVELEKFLGPEDGSTVVIPQVRAVDVSRQQGLIVLQVASTLRTTPGQRSGLLQLDASELPPHLADRTWDYIFRYAALPYELALNVEKVEPRIRVDEYVHAYLEPTQLTVDLLAIYQIERAGVFQLLLNVPADYEVRQVQGQAADSLEAAAVDAFHVDPAVPGRLQVNLASKAQGRIGLLVRLVRKLEDPNLLTPTGSSSTIPLPLPRIDATRVDQVTGKLVVFAPESLRVTPATQSGLQNISFREATEGVEYLRRAGNFAAMREVVALSYAREAVDLSLTVQRRRPQVEVRQFLVTRIESGVVRYEATFFYDIRYSPVKELRIDLPQDVAGLARNETPGIRDEVINPPPEGLPQGYVAWRLSGESELLGNVQIQLNWQQNIEPLNIGQSIDVVVPQLRPAGTDRAWGQIVAAKSETIDIRPQGEITGLRPIDPQHDLMPGAQAADAARAFEFQQSDWNLTLTATRFQLVEVKRTSIEQALLRLVVTRSDQVDVHALYRLRSAQQRLEVIFPQRVDPQQSFAAQPLRVNGQPVTLEKGDQQQYFIPLVGVSPDEPLLVELRYSVSGDPRLLDFPTFPSEPAVGQVSMSVYIPEELTLLSTRGPWNLEQFNPWRVTLSELAATRNPLRVKSDEELYAELTRGINVSGDPLSSFSVQGMRYLFSTLRPEPPPDGALYLRTIDSRTMNTVLFGVAGILAVVLMLRPLREKLMAIGLALILIILAGVFWPTAAMQLLDGKLLLAAVVTLLLWGTAEAVKLLSLWRQQGLWHVLTNGHESVVAVPVEAESVASAGPPAEHAAELDKPQGGDRHE